MIVAGVLGVLEIPVRIAVDAMHDDVVDVARSPDVLDAAILGVGASTIVVDPPFDELPVGVVVHLWVCELSCPAVGNMFGLVQLGHDSKSSKLN